jgi:stage V sporulation protein G
VKLPTGNLPRDDDGRLRLYADIAHPINAACREAIQKRVVAEYEAELVRSREPGYVSRYDAIGDE